MDPLLQYNPDMQFEYDGNDIWYEGEQYPEEEGEEEGEFENVDPYESIECLFENRLELKGPPLEISRFYEENKRPDGDLTLHSSVYGVELPQLWVSPNRSLTFLSDAFDVEWVEDLHTYLFRTLYVYPDGWLKIVSKRYPSIRFMLIHADKKENESEEWCVRNGIILRHNKGDYCEYWEPYCEECDESIAITYNSFYDEYVCNDCNHFITGFIPECVCI